MQIAVYTRRGCHLCAEAERLVRQLAPATAEIRLVDIDADAALVERYTVRVPVVAVDGVEVAELVVEPDDLAAAFNDRTGS